MKFIIPVLCLFSLPVFSQTVSTTSYTDIFESVSYLVNSVSSSSDLSTRQDKQVLTFTPNVATGAGLAVETKYINLAYFFSGSGSGTYKNQPSGSYNDIRLNFHWKQFDFRLNYQNYQGAVVKDNGKEEFYSDYRVRAKNVRFLFYFNEDHLNYVREGIKLAHKASGNEGLNFSQSWFVGGNFDQRSIALPQNLAPEHMATISLYNLKYNTSFSALSAGPVMGYDGMAFWENFFGRFKFGGGPAFQTGGTTVAQYELAMNLGFTIKKNHLISMNGDVYTISFKDNDQRIYNTNTQVLLGYTYVFL